MDTSTRELSPWFSFDSVPLSLDIRLGSIDRRRCGEVDYQYGESARGGRANLINACDVHAV
jgi:hypothetical protein